MGKVKSKSRLGKDKYTFCHEERHWKIDSPKLKKKDKGKSMSNACVIECGCSTPFRPDPICGSEPKSWDAQIPLNHSIKII